MRILFNLLLISILLSCSENDLTKIRSENKQLKAELEALKQTMYQSIVIPQKDIYDYFQPVTFGLSTVKTNEENYFSTYLVLRKLPDDYRIEWKSTPEAMKIKKYELRYNVYSTYTAPGVHEFHGFYKITYPNHRQTEFSWYREFEVVN